MAAPLSVNAPSSVQNSTNSSSRRLMVSRGVLMIETYIHILTWPIFHVFIPGWEFVVRVCLSTPHIPELFASHLTVKRSRGQVLLWWPKGPFFLQWPEGPFLGTFGPAPFLWPHDLLLMNIILLMLSKKKKFWITIFI